MAALSMKDLEKIRPDERKKRIVEALFPLVQSTAVSYAREITQNILEMKNVDIIELMNDRVSFKERVQKLHDYFDGL